MSWNTLKRFVLARVLFWSSTASWNLLSLRKSSFACLELPRQPMWAVYLLMSHYNLTKAYESIHLQVQAFPSLPETISVPCKNRCYLCLSPLTIRFVFLATRHPLFHEFCYCSWHLSWHLAVEDQLEEVKEDLHQAQEERPKQPRQREKVLSEIHLGLLDPFVWLAQLAHSSVPRAAPCHLFLPCLRDWGTMSEGPWDNIYQLQNNAHQYPTMS